MRLFPRKKEKQNETKKGELGWCRRFCKLMEQSPGRSGRSESRAQQQQNLAHGMTLEIALGVRNARNACAGRLKPGGWGRGQSREHTARRGQAHSAEHGVRRTGGEDRAESRRHGGGRPTVPSTECRVQTTEDRGREDRAESTGHSGCEPTVPSTECRVQTIDYRGPSREHRAWRGQAHSAKPGVRNRD